MRQVGMLLVREEAFRRKRCHAQGCLQPATYYVFLESQPDGSRRALGVYCRFDSYGWENDRIPPITHDRKRFDSKAVRVPKP